ncbi:MAG TPA: glutamine--fructose-6-phosphate transaminase (isomerizing) [bacterium]
MCGIVGYVGGRTALPILVDGLRRLEYRGYDSAGVAILDGGEITVCRAVGKIAALEAALGAGGVPGTVGIGHTRWATHGRPSEQNAHPHRSGPFVVVHNGIIENHLALKKRLQGRGYAFSSETDTEVVAVLLHSHYRGGDCRRALARTLAEIEGSYALAILCVEEPGRLFAAREGSPLVIGRGQGEQFLASDVPALIEHTREVIYLGNGETAVLSREGVDLRDAAGRARRPKVCTVPWDPVSASRGGYKHFMLKEIHEQPHAVLDTFRTRVSQEKGRVMLDEEAGLTPQVLSRIRRVRFLACGTSWHAGLVGEHMVERLAGLPAEVDLASEFRYRGAPAEEGVLTVAISQSGETADTRAAFAEARSKGGFRLAVCNVLGSSITREADGVLYTHAGPEISVASTKAFTSQLTALYLLALFLGQQRGRLARGVVAQHIADLVRLPKLIQRALALDPAMAELGQRFAKSRDCLYLGRGVNYPAALEGALKLKEISYVHAEGYAGGEMKHGPIALIDAELPVVVLAPRDENFRKMYGNLEEVRARHGVVITFTDRAGRDLAAKAECVFTVPRTNPFLTPLLLTVPLQLFAYHLADARGHDVDQPRNLAKSVTVE